MGSLEQSLREIKNKFLTFFFKPYEWQKRFIETVRRKNITLVTASNKIGKTCAGVNIVLSWVLGFEPWTQSDKPFRGCVKGPGGFYYKPSSLGKEPPVDVVICGEDWKMHLGRTVVRELKKWAPADWYRTRKNEQGVEYFWEWDNGSTITLMCYTQDDDLFESFRAQGAWMDEPPPKQKFDAMSRGLFLDCGKIMLTMTPLKEAWILDELILSNRSDVGIVDKLSVTCNEDLKREEDQILAEMGLSDEQIARYYDLLFYDDPEQKRPVSDKGKRAESYLHEVVDPKKTSKISKLKILRFIKDINPLEVAPRVFGEFKFLVGRVLPEFDPSVHMIDPFEIPSDWPVVAMIDFHLSKPQAISYWACSPDGIHYCIKEVWRHMTAEEVAEEIIRSKKQNKWNIQEAFIDPLSKGDTQYVRNRFGDVQDSFTTIFNKLLNFDITLWVASKDKESGIQNIRSMLRGPNGIPICYLFTTCERHQYEALRWVYDDNGVPSKRYDDHFMENWYRYTLTGNVYRTSPPDHFADVEPSDWLAM